MLKICKGCGMSFNIKPSKYEKRVYCTQECMAKDYCIRMRGDANPRYYKADEKVCEHCRKVYSSYNKNQRYCSKECGFAAPSAQENRIIAQRRVRNPDAYPPPPPVEKQPKREKPMPPVDQVKQAYLWRGVPVQRRKSKPRPRPRPEPKTIQCKRCNESFTKTSGYQKYCEDCREITIICVQCGKSFVSRRQTDTPITCSISCAGKYCGMRKRGEISNLWRGGVTPEQDILRNSSKYRVWRKKVFARDNRTCQACFQKGGKLEVHHIKMVVKYPDLMFDVTNGITLCRKCHVSIRQHEELYEEQFYAITRGTRSA